MKVNNCASTPRRNSSTNQPKMSFKSLYRISCTEKEIVSVLIPSDGEEFVHLETLKKAVDEGKITPGSIDQKGTCKLNMPGNDILIVTSPTKKKCATLTWGISDLNGKIKNGYRIKVDHDKSYMLDECLDLIATLKQKCKDKLING